MKKIILIFIYIVIYKMRYPDAVLDKEMDGLLDKVKKELEN